MNTYLARTMDVTGISESVTVTAEDPDRARVLVHNFLLENRQRPQTILICIPGGKQ